MEKDIFAKDNETIDLEAGGVQVSVERPAQDTRATIGDTRQMMGVRDVIAERQKGEPADVMRDRSEVDHVKERNILNRSERIHFTLVGSSAATAANYGTIFYAVEPCFIRRVTEVHQTKGTDAGSVGLNVEKLTGTQAPDGGTEVLSTNFNLKGNDNTVQDGAFVSDRAARTLYRGDRIGLKDSGTLTALAHVTVVIEVEYI